MPEKEAPVFASAAKDGERQERPGTSDRIVGPIGPATPLISPDA